MNSNKSTQKKLTVAKKTSSRPRDVKHMDKEKVTDYSSVLNSSVKRSKLPRRPGRRRLRNKLRRKIRKLRVELRKCAFQKDDRLERMLERAHWLQRVTRNPNIAFYEDDEFGSDTDDESAVSRILSD